MLTVVLLVLCIRLSHAQQKVDRQEEQPATQLQFTVSLQPWYNREEKGLNLQHFRAAAGWSKRPDRLMEVGLSNIGINTRKSYFYGSMPLNTPTVTKTYSLGVDAAYYVFFKPEDTRLKPYINLGWASYVHYYRNIPGIPISFPSKDLNWSNSLLLSLGVQYHFSGLFFKLELPITSLQLHSRFQRVENPAIPIRAQKRNSLTASYFPFDIIPVEIGIGYRISK